MMARAAQSLTAPLANFWHWWSGEIAGMIPDRLKEAASGRNHIDIYLHDNAITIESVQAGKGEQRIAEKALEELDEDDWIELASLMQSASPRLFLAEQDVLEIDVKLPRKAASDPKAAIELQLPILSPMELSYIDWNCYRVKEDAQHLHMKLLIVKAARLDAIEECFSQQGLMPPGIAVKYDNHIINFRKPLILENSLANSRRKQLRFASALLLLSIPFTTMAGAQIIQSSNQGDAQAIEEQASMKLADWRGAQTVEKRKRLLSTVANKKLASKVLDTLAQTIPGSSWVQSVSYGANGIIAVEINAPSKLDVGSLLTESKAFKRITVENIEELDPSRSLFLVEMEKK